MVVPLLIPVLVAVALLVVVVIVVVTGEWSMDLNLDSFSCGDLFPPFSRFEK